MSDLFCPVLLVTIAGFVLGFVLGAIALLMTKEDRRG